MKKTNPKSKTGVKKPTENSSKTLFDHINHIRNVKSKDYFDKLSESDKKTFNHYMLCRFLSMDPNCIYEAQYVSSVYDKMDSKSFYKLCCALFDSIKYTPYIKSKNKNFNKELLGYISKKYQIGLSESNEYCEVLFSSVEGRDELHEICAGFGVEPKEIKKLLKKE